jgi:hypothetical protein
MRAVGRRLGISLCTVQRWVKRSGGKRLDRIDLDNRPSGPAVPARRTPAAQEDLVLATRAELRATSDLGEYGAAAVRARLIETGIESAPSVRTINRIFERRGALDGGRRVRRPAPPPGWYLSDLSRRRVELDSFDIVEGLTIGRTSTASAVDIEVLNAVSLFGGLVGSWPSSVVTAKFVADCLVEHWRTLGLPRYAQFDNDNVFQGPHQWPDTFGRITRLCLGLGIVPVFAPPRETGFQAAIESYNGRWQAKVWARFRFDSLKGVINQSDRFIAAARRRLAPRIESAPPRQPFPTGRWCLAQCLQKPLAGQVIFLRRSDAQGRVSILGRSFDVDRTWPGRLVRANVELDAHRIRFYALRRREPSQHRLLATASYEPPTKAFED